MRSLFLASVSLALAATATAQSPNYFGVYSGCTNYTSRGTLGTNAGDNMMQVPSTHYAGIGHDATGAGTVLTGFRHVLQDQNSLVTEPYSFIIRADNAGQPDASAGGILLQTAPLQSPSGTGINAWIITATLTTPSTALPLCNTYYQGLNLAANAGWTTDGLSSHICTYYLLGTTQADNPAPNAPNLAWNIDGATMAITQPSARCIRYELMLDAAVLNMGGTDPTQIGNTSNCVSTLLNAAGNPRTFGAGGMWPENGGGRVDGIDYRVGDFPNQSGLFAVFLGVNIGCPGIPLGSIASGALYLNPGGAFVQVAGGSLDTTGAANGTVLPPGAAPAILVNRYLDFQAFTVGPTFALPGKLTNRASVQYLP
ncbi:MAG: hypothetical protein R3F56_06315 [Planctomycetota bacterium]